MAKCKDCGADYSMPDRCAGCGGHLMAANADPRDAEIVRLKAEVERLTKLHDRLVEELTEEEHLFVAARESLDVSLKESAALKAEVERLTAQAGILMENESIARSESAALREQLETEKAYARTLMRNLGRMIALTQGPDAHMIAKDLSLPLVEDVIGQAVRALKREVL